MAAQLPKKKNGGTAAPSTPKPLTLARPSKAASKAPPKKYAASFCPGPAQELPQPFVTAVQALENNLGLPVWMFIQSRSGPLNEIDEQVRRAFFVSKNMMQAGKPIALLLDSPGGYAKSAATLLTLGADTILLNNYAELGPLDAQLLDPEREQITSALDEVQTLERLHAFALDAVDQTMMLLMSRSGKKMETLLPATLRFVSDMMRPMFEKVDVVHYTQLARILKVAEEYAIRF